MVYLFLILKFLFKGNFMWAFTNYDDWWWNNWIILPINMMYFLYDLCSWKCVFHICVCNDKVVLRLFQEDPRQQHPWQLDSSLTQRKEIKSYLHGLCCNLPILRRLFFSWNVDHAGYIVVLVTCMNLFLEFLFIARLNVVSSAILIFNVGTSIRDTQIFFCFLSY